MLHIWGAWVEIWPHRQARMREGCVFPSGPSGKYKGKSLNNRNFVLKCMGKYAQRKILFRDTEWLLSNMPYRGRDDRAV